MRLYGASMKSEFMNFEIQLEAGTECAGAYTGHPSRSQ